MKKLSWSCDTYFIEFLTFKVLSLWVMESTVQVKESTRVTEECNAY